MNRRIDKSSHVKREGGYKNQVGEPKGSKSDLRNKSAERSIHSKGHNNERSQSREPFPHKWNPATHSKKELKNRHSNRGGSQEMFGGSGRRPNEGGDVRNADARTGIGRSAHMRTAKPPTITHGVRQMAHPLPNQREVNMVVHHKKGNIDKSAYSKKHHENIHRGKPLMNLLKKPEGTLPNPSHNNSKHRDVSQESFHRGLPNSRLIRKENSTHSNPMLTLDTKGNKPTQNRSDLINARMEEEHFLKKNKTTQNFLDRETTRQRENMGIPQEEPCNKKIMAEHPSHCVHLNDRRSREGNTDQSHFTYMRNNATSKRSEIPMQGKKHEQRRHEHMNHGKNILQGDHLHHVKEQQQRDRVMPPHKEDATAKCTHGTYYKNSAGRNENSHSEKITKGTIIQKNCIRSVHGRSRNLEQPMNRTHPQFGRSRVSQMGNLVRKSNGERYRRRGIPSNGTTNTWSESSVPVDSSESGSSGPGNTSGNPLRKVNSGRRPFFPKANSFLMTQLSILSLKDPQKTTQTKSYISIKNVHHQKAIWNGSYPSSGPKSSNPTQAPFTTSAPYTSATRENTFNKNRDRLNTRGGSNSLLFNLPNKSDHSHKGARENYSYHPHEHAQPNRHIRCDKNDPSYGLSSEEFHLTTEKFKREVKASMGKKNQEGPPSRNNQFDTYGKHNGEMCVKIDTSCVGGNIDDSIEAITANAAHGIVAAEVASVVKTANRNELHPTGSLYKKNLLHLTHEKVKKGLTFDEMRRKSFEALHISESAKPHVKYKHHEMRDMRNKREVHDLSNHSMHEREERNKKNARRSVTPSSESVERNFLPKKRKLNGTEAKDRQSQKIIPPSEPLEKNKMNLPSRDANMSYNKTAPNSDHGRSDKSMLKTNFKTEKTTNPLQNRIYDATKRGQDNPSTREENKKENCINIFSQKKNNFHEKNVTNTCSGSYKKDPLPTGRKNFAVPSELIKNFNKQFNITVGSSYDDKMGKTTSAPLYHRAAVSEVSTLAAVGRNKGASRERSLSGNDEEKLNKEKSTMRVNNVPTGGSGAILSKNLITTLKEPQVSSQIGAPFGIASKSQQEKQSNDAKEDAYFGAENGPFCEEIDEAFYDIFGLDALSKEKETQKETSRDGADGATVAHTPNPCNGASLVKKTNWTKVTNNGDEKPRGKTCKEEELGTKTEGESASGLIGNQDVTLAGAAEKVDATKESDETSAASEAEEINITDTDHSTDNANAVPMRGKAHREKRLPGSSSAHGLSNKDAPAGKGKEKDERSHTSKGASNKEEGTTCLHERHYGKNVEDGVDKITDKNNQPDFAKEKNECLPFLGDADVIGRFLQMDWKKGVSSAHDRKKEEHSEVCSEVHVDEVRTDHTVTVAHVQGHLGATAQRNHATTHNEKGKGGDLHQDKVQTKPLTGMKDRPQEGTAAVSLNEENKLSMEKKKKEEVHEDKRDKAKERDIKKKANQRSDADALGTTQFDLFEERPKAHHKEGYTGEYSLYVFPGEKEKLKRDVEEMHETRGNSEQRGKANTDKGELRMCLPTNAKQRSVDIEEKIPRAKPALYLPVGVTCAHQAKTFPRQKKKDYKEEDERTDKKKREKHSMNDDKQDGGGDGGANISGGVNESRDCLDDGEKSPSKKTQNNQFGREDNPTMIPPKCADMEESAQRPTTKVTAEPSYHKKRKIISSIPLRQDGTAHRRDLRSGEMHEGKSFFSTEDESPFCHMYSPRNVAAQIGTVQKDGTPVGSSSSSSGSEVAEDMMNDPLVSNTHGKRRTSLASTKRIEVNKRNSFLDGLSPDESLMEDNNEDCNADPFCDLPFCHDSNIIYQSDERTYEDNGSYRQTLNPNGEISFSLNNDDLFDEAEQDTESRYNECARGKNGKNFFDEVEKEQRDDNKPCQSNATNQSKHRKCKQDLFVNFAQKQMNGEIVDYTNGCPILGCIPDGYTNVSTEGNHLVERSDQNPFCTGEKVKSTFMEYVVRNSLNVTIDSRLINDNESVKKKYDLQINGFKIVQQIDALYQRKETNQNRTDSSDSSLVEICDCNASFGGSNGEVNGLPLYEGNLIEVGHLHKGVHPSPGENYQDVAKKEDTLFQNDLMEDIAHIKACTMNVCQLDDEEDNSNCGDRSANHVKDGQPPADLPSRSEPCLGVINEVCSPGDEPHSATTGDLTQRGGVTIGNYGVCLEMEKQIDDAAMSSVTLPAGKDLDASGRYTLGIHPGEEISAFSMPYSKGKKITMRQDEGCAMLDFEEIYHVDDLTMCPESGLTVCASFEQPEGPEKWKTEKNSRSRSSSRSSVITTDGRIEGENLPPQKCTEEDELGIVSLDVPSGELHSGSLFQFFTRGSSDGGLSEEQEEEGIDQLEDPVEEVDQRKVDQMKDDLAAVHPPEGKEGTTLDNAKKGDEGEGANRIEESTAHSQQVHEGGRSKGQANKPARRGARSGPHPLNQLDEESSLGSNKWGDVDGAPPLDVTKVDVSTDDKLDDAELTCNGTSGQSAPEKEVPINGKATPADDLPLGGKDEEGRVSLHANHRVEAEKLNQDIPYITNIHKEMHRSPVMPLRIEAFHSLEDQRLIYGRPEWQKYLCPLCDKAYYTPNSYMKNYTHYLNEHWKKRKILGGYIIFPCKLIHNGMEEQQEEKDKSTLPSDVVHTPFINSNDYYCALKKFESEKNITIEGVNNKCASSKGSTSDSTSAQFLVSTTRAASLEKRPNQSEQKNKGKHRRSSRVIFCDEIQVREYDIELSRIEKFGASIGPVFTEDKEEGTTPSTESKEGRVPELANKPAEGDKNGMLSREVEAKDGASPEEDTPPEQTTKWAMKKCNKDISSNVEDVHLEANPPQSGSVNLKDSVYIPGGKAKKDQEANTPVMSNTERKIIDRRKKKKQDEDPKGSHAPNRKNPNGGHRKGVSNNLDETPLLNGKRTERSGDHMDIYKEEGIGKSKSGGEEQPNEEENITSSFRNYPSELINGEKKGEQKVNRTEDDPSLNHANMEKNQTKDESGKKNIDEEHSPGAPTNECTDPSGSVKVEGDPPRSDSLNELISSLFSIDNNSPSSNSENKSVPFSCLLYEESLQIKEQPLNEILLENRIENSKENIFIPVKKKMGKRMRNGTENMHKRIISKYKRKIKICTLNEKKKESTSFFDFKNYENVYMPPKNVSLNLPPPEKETHILKKVIRPKKKEKIPSLHLNCRQSARIKNRNKLTQ
ncbi:Uncharacterized protein PCOAH_00031110 [Plasmodium coatneyi]|uniref:Uncharacterized protein n=1 Tax=Plasmodium coatneyi TaxID=208452 RepID=A0A1B1E195_9APIC|nr:Uncharacterized protein PCOAH_00031110 [Plasmodium coatneyi]ANQ08811.1 Uncharacterized protein PCOAH_00031110 [Plasmodium coatneyi]